MKVRPLIVALVMLLPACGTSRDPLVLGAVYPTAGGVGMGGLSEYRGVRLAVELANRRGGVDGRPVELRLEVANSPEAAPDAIRRLDEAGIDLIFGSYGSTISAPAVDESAERDLLFWETGAVGELAPGYGDRIFRVAPTGATLGDAGVGFIESQILPRLGHERARYGVAYVNDAYGRAVGLGAADAIRRRGLPLARTEAYDLRTADYGAIAERLDDAGVEVLFVASYLDDAIALRRAMVERGIDLVASVGTSSSYCMHAFGAALGDDAVGLFASDKPDGETLNTSALAPEAREAFAWARREYLDRFGHELTAPALAGFAAGWGLLRHVLPSAEGTGAAEVAEATRSIALPPGSLPNGSGLRFAPEGSPDPSANLAARSVIWEWVRPYERAVVWPPEMATSPVAVLPI